MKRDRYLFRDQNRGFQYIDDNISIEWLTLDCRTSGKRAQHLFTSIKPQLSFGALARGLLELL